MTSNNPIGQGDGADQGPPTWAAPGSAPDAAPGPPEGWSAVPTPAVPGAWPVPGPPAGYPAPGYGPVGHSPVGYGPVGYGPAGYGGHPVPGWGSLNPMLMHKPGILPLRPLNVGDVLSAAFTAIRNAPRVYFGLVLLMQLFTLLVCVVIALAVAAVAFGSNFDNSLAELLLGVGAGGFVLVSTTVSGMCAGILAYPLNQQAVGRRPGLGETWRMTRGRIPAFLGFVGLMVAGWVALLIPTVAVFVAAAGAQEPAVVVAAVLVVVATMVLSVWLAVRISLSLPALFTERLGPVAAVRRSWTLTDRLFWRTLGNLALMYLVVAVIQWVIQFGFQMLAVIVILVDNGSESNGAMVATISIYLLGMILAIVLTQPFMAVTTAVLHLDSRTRKDGFDLDLGQVAAEVAAGQHTDGWPPLSRNVAPAFPHGQPVPPSPYPGRYPQP